MAKLRFWRKPKVKAYRKRGAAPLLPELFEMSVPARRANRLLAALALFGAFGTVALAVALTPGAQQSASSANASQQASQQASQMTSEGAVQLIGIAPQATAVEKASEPTLGAAAALPQQAAKSDRLPQTPWAPRPRSSEHAPSADLSGAVFKADTPDEAAAVPEPKPELDAEGDIGPDFALGSEPPPPGATGLEAGHLSGDDFRVEPSAAASDEPSGPVADEPGAAAEVNDDADAPVNDEAAAPVNDEPEQQASLDPGAGAAAQTRSSVVKSDVNMRAGPDNGAKVIRVVPRNSNVEVLGCDYWCEVVYAGKRGFIYKGFLRGAKS